MPATREGVTTRGAAFSCACVSSGQDAPGRLRTRHDVRSFGADQRVYRDRQPRGVADPFLLDHRLRAGRPEAGEGRAGLLAAQMGPRTFGRCVQVFDAFLIHVARIRSFGTVHVTSLADDGFHAGAAVDCARSAEAFHLGGDAPWISGRLEIFDSFVVGGWGRRPSGIAHVASEERDVGGRRALCHATEVRDATPGRVRLSLGVLLTSLRHSGTGEALLIEPHEGVVHAYFVLRAPIAEQAVDGHVRQ